MQRQHAGVAHFFSPSQKKLLAVAVLVGGVSGIHRLQLLVRKAQKEQRQICSDLDSKRKKHSSVLVNKRFINRLLHILSICVPSVASKEAFLILLQTCLLVSRTLLTEYTSAVEGRCASHLIALEFPQFGQAVLAFALLGIPASVVNSGLKFMQHTIKVCLQQRLTLHLHQKYCSNRAYYAASIMGGLTNADQRLTEDVEKFAFAVSELYSYTFKPVLDIVLFTRSLSRRMGYRGQFMLYGYYVAAAFFLRSISPPLAQMTAHEAALTGAFRAAHQRLVSHAEEVAFNDPPAGAAEQLVLNLHLWRLTRYSFLASFQRFLQQIADGYFVKYFASVLSLLTYAAPIYFREPELRGTASQMTQEYIRSVRLLQNTARAVGDLILLYKRISGLASHTSRVSEVLEQVQRMSGEDSEHKLLYNRNMSGGSLSSLHLADSNGSMPFLRHGSQADPDQLDVLPARRLRGDTVKLYRLCLDAPDGMPLVRELTFEVAPGCSVMLMGPNGSGKSSLFRVMAGLWPLKGGEITLPDKRQLFYLSQKPYLVTGSLRDQLLYPEPPKAVWRNATTSDRVFYTGVSGYGVEEGVSSEEDDRIKGCLAAVELSYLLSRGKGLDQVQMWNETLSGGEKQRLAMARLLYHRPTFAVLDECTSAVSADGETKLYSELRKAGITCLSIAHRPALRNFHSLVIHFDGTVSQTGKGWWVETLPPAAQ